MPAPARRPKLDTMRSVAATCRRLAHPLRVVTAVALVASVLSHEISAVHVVCGAVFVLAGAGHVLAHDRWLRTVTRRIGRGLPRQITADAMLDGLMAVLGVVTAATGVAMAMVPGGTAARDDLSETHVHAGVLLVVVVIVHVVRHKRRRGARPDRQAATARSAAQRARTTPAAGSPH